MSILTLCNNLVFLDYSCSEVLAGDSNFSSLSPDRKHPDRVTIMDDGLILAPCDDYTIAGCKCLHCFNQAVQFPVPVSTIIYPGALSIPVSHSVRSGYGNLQITPSSHSIPCPGDLFVCRCNTPQAVGEISLHFLSGGFLVLPITSSESTPFISSSQR